MNKGFLLIALILCFTLRESEAQSSSECLPDETFFTLFVQNQNFEDAIQLCEDEGLVLARVDNQLRFTFALELLRNNLNSQDRAWIGIYFSSKNETHVPLCLIRV